MQNELDVNPPSNSLVQVDIQTPQVMTDDDRVDFTLNTRVALIKQIMPEGKLDLSDDTTTNNVIKLLDGIDRASLARKKIKVEEKAVRSMDETRRLVAAGLIASRGQSAKQTDAARVVEVSADLIPDPMTVVGETAQTPQITNIDSFMGQFETVSEDDTL